MVAKTEAFTSTPVPRGSSGYTLQPSCVDSCECLGRDHRFTSGSCADLGLASLSRPTSSSSMAAPNGLDVLGKEVKRLMQGIQKLRHLGIERDVQLPKIVVVGDQSTGKSSVIEGISEIKVPRSAGCCTRVSPIHVQTTSFSSTTDSLKCPLEINLNESEAPWSCRIFLSIRYAYQGKSAAVSRDRPFGPWTDTEPVEQEFVILNNKRDVPDALKWAQLAILNPGTNFRAYIPGQNRAASNYSEVEFSPNVVRIDISGPFLPNLAFYDLPGIIAIANNDDGKYLPKLIKKLAEIYMSDPSTIILKTVPMNHDAANSGAHRLITLCKAQERTIGVLTKPDLISPDSLNQWVRILSNEDHRLPLGYFSVMNDADPNVEHSKARFAESLFFDRLVKEVHPVFAPYRHRFGTLHLQEHLSTLLAKQIQKRYTTRLVYAFLIITDGLSLPSIRITLERQLAGTTAELASLPKPPEGNLSIQIYECFAKLSAELKQQVDGSAGTDSLFMKWRSKMLRFRKDLTDSRPILQLPVAQRKSDRESEPPKTPISSSIECHVISDEDDDLPPSQSSNSRMTPSHLPDRSKKRNAESKGEQSTPVKRSRLSSIPLYSERSTVKYTLQIIQRMLAGADTTGLPGSRNPVVTGTMCRTSFSHWAGKMNNVLDETFSLCLDCILGCLQSAFPGRRETVLFTHTVANVRAFLSKSFDEQRAFAARLLHMERDVMSLDRHAAGADEEAALKECRQAWRSARARAKVFEDESHSGKVWPDAMLKDKVSKVTDEQLGPDPFAREIEQWAIVRGYYHYASRRFAENVALSIRSELFDKLQEQLPSVLRGELGLDKADGE